MSNQKAIEISALKKNYGDVLDFSKVSLTIKEILK